MDAELKAIRFPDREAKRHHHQQSAPATVWTIVHGFNVSPVNVAVFNTAGKQIWATVATVDLNTVNVTFSTPHIGKAIVTA